MTALHGFVVAVGVGAMLGALGCSGGDTGSGGSGGQGGDTGTGGSGGQGGDTGTGGSGGTSSTISTSDPGPCGDTTSADTFFNGLLERKIPLIYESGDKGPDDILVMGTFELRVLESFGWRVVIEMLTPKALTAKIWDFHDSTDSYQDLGDMVEVLFKPSVGLHGTLQCKKSTGEWMVEYRDPKDPSFFTRWISP